MGGHKFLALLLAAGAAAVADPGPARGQCRLCEAPTTTRDAGVDGKDVSIEIETTLDFDRLILSGAGEGSVTIRPDGSSSAQGSVASASPRALAGTVVVRGEAGRAVRVELPARIMLYSPSGGEIIFEDVVSDLPALPKLDAAGTLTFRFGGRLRLRGDAEGSYRGDLPITVEYL